MLPAPVDIIPCPWAEEPFDFGMYCLYAELYIVDIDECISMRKGIVLRRYKRTHQTRQVASNTPIKESRIHHNRQV